MLKEKYTTFLCAFFVSISAVEWIESHLNKKKQHNQKHNNDAHILNVDDNDNDYVPMVQCRQTFDHIIFISVDNSFN